MYFSIVFAISHYASRHAKSEEHRCRLCGALMALVISLTAIGIPLLMSSTIAGYENLTELGNFQYRVDSILEHRYRMWNSPFLPESVYQFLKKLFGLPYHPELRDATREYKGINIYAYHLRNTGVVEYEYEGRSYPMTTAVPFCCVNHGEADSCRAEEHLVCLSLPDSQEIQPNSLLSLGGFRGSAILACYDLPKTFRFIRCFCLPRSMTAGTPKSPYEGFVFDLRGISHPPDSVIVHFVTDRRINDGALYRLERSWNFGDRVLAKPVYQQQALIEELKEVSEQGVLDSVAADLKHGQLSWGANELSYCRHTLWTQGEERIFLLRYRVEGSILPNERVMRGTEHIVLGDVR